MSRLIIGLTGGIGSGKTAASDWFQEQGITIVDADVVAREVVEPGTVALEQITVHFGAGVLQADGTLDRATLRRIVFETPEQRRWLEQLLHPLIAQEIARQLAAADSPYAMLVSPLLFETGQKNFVARTLLIDVPEELQLARTAARDGVEATQVKSIMAAQMSRDERRRRADDIVVNDAGLAELHAQLRPIHDAYLGMAAG
ncbi:MAG: dephospho-CoA kinase [Gammaproteobacteria bacterium]